MAETYNHDVKGMSLRLDRMNKEINQAASGNAAYVSKHDLGRWRSLHAWILAYHDWVMAQPSPLDLPESHPTLLMIPDGPVYPTVENELVNDLVRLLVLARQELVNSQSSGQAGGLVSYDSVRFLAIMDKASKLLDLAEATYPLDLPESMPQRIGVAPGQGGVNQPTENTPTMPSP